MLTRDQFLQSVAQETAICKHLHGKLNRDRLDYAPGENMRNTLELMRYLTFCGQGPAEALIHGDWSGIARLQEEASTMEVDEFPARMDAQLEKIRGLVGEVSDADLLEKEGPLPWGAEKLGHGLVMTTLQFLTAYRMQLFDHVKAAGATELSTYNCWRGMDAP